MKEKEFEQLIKKYGFYNDKEDLYYLYNKDNDSLCEFIEYVLPRDTKIKVTKEVLSIAWRDGYGLHLLTYILGD